MAAGQLLNLFIVQYVLKRDDIWIIPRMHFKYRAELSHLMNQYWPLAAAALFAGLVIPVAMVLAMSLPDGSVSAFNMETKVVLFVTGLVAAAMSVVLLPYFSSLITKNNLMEVRRELSFFLLLATFLSMPVSAGLFLWSEAIIRIIFEGGNFDSGQLSRSVA